MDFIDRGHAHPVQPSAAAQVARDHGGEPEPCGSAATSSCHASLRRAMRANPPIAANALTSTAGSDQDRATDAQADDPPAAAGRRCLIGHTIDVLDARLTLLACGSPNSSVATALNWFSSARAAHLILLVELRAVLAAHGCGQQRISPTSSVGQQAARQASCRPPMAATNSARCAAMRSAMSRACRESASTPACRAAYASRKS
jgi:hypothetical protein